MKHITVSGSVAAVMVAAALSAGAADVLMNGSDAAGESSFASGLHWEDGLAPSASNAYFTGGYTLRGSATATQTFAGKPLTVGNGGELFIYNVPWAANDDGTIVPTLILNGCTVVASGSGISGLRAFEGYRGGWPPEYKDLNKITLAGDAVLDSRGGGTLYVAAQLVGAGGVTIKGKVQYWYTPLNGWHHVHEYAGDTTIESGGELSESYCYMPRGTGKGNLIVKAGGKFTSFRLDQVNGLSGGGTVVTPQSLTVGNGDASGDFSGTISGGILVKVGAGTQILRGANTYTGATTLNGGILKAGIASAAGVSGAFGKNSAVTLANADGVTLDLAGFNTQIGSLAGAGATGGRVTLGAATLTVGGNNTSTSFAGMISGAGGLTKIGTGTQTLTGANDYTGDTRVEGGTLSLGRAYLADDKSVSITDGATLNLNYTGTDTISALHVDGIAQAPGTWGGPGSGAQHETPLITGAGMLLVRTESGAVLTIK